jgi:hypothetical protein
VYYFAEKFMVWSAFQALVMLVQNRYQKRRMYTRIAMGKNSAMDVVSGESSGSAGQLMVLYPLLFSKSLAASFRLCLSVCCTCCLFDCSDCSTVRQDINVPVAEISNLQQKQLQACSNSLQAMVLAQAVCVLIPRAINLPIQFGYENVGACLLCLSAGCSLASLAAVYWCGPGSQDLACPGQP